MDKKRIGVGCLLQLGAGWHGKNQKVWKPDRFQFGSRSRKFLSRNSAALQVLVLVPKGRRIVAEGGASDSGHSRNPGETEEVIPAPEGAAETPIIRTSGRPSVALSRTEGRSAGF